MIRPEFTGEVILRPSFAPRPGISHVLFDFDGTLSLIRQGWPEVMVPMFAEVLPRRARRDRGRPPQMAFEDIMRLNGKQTIYQMIQLADRIRERGGEPREPLWYKHEYLRRLDERIGDRTRRAAPAARSTPDELLVHGATAAAGAPAASAACRSTWPAAPTRSPSSRRPSCSASARTSAAASTAPWTITSRSPRRWSSSGSSARTGSTASSCSRSATATSRSRTPRRSAGLAVAVASDEANNGSGRMDEWKRERLSGVGADVVIPDFRDAAPLLRS